jgi:hypothetical protein
LGDESEFFMMIWGRGEIRFAKNAHIMNVFQSTGKTKMLQTASLFARLRRGEVSTGLTASLFPDG